MKSIDMPAFVGKDFDCELFDRSSLDGGKPEILIAPLSEVVEVSGNKTYWYDVDRDGFRLWRNHCRPRLNKPQVLDSWDWVPDGLVWIAYEVTNSGKVIGRKVNSHDLRSGLQMLGGDPKPFAMAECIGVEAPWKEWGEQHGMPVVEV